MPLNFSAKEDQDDLVEDIKALLICFNGEDSLKRLFWSVLSYNRENSLIALDNALSNLKFHVFDLRVFATHIDGSVVVRASVFSSFNRRALRILLKFVRTRFANYLVIFQRVGVERYTILLSGQDLAHIRYIRLPTGKARLQQTAEALSKLCVFDLKRERVISSLDIEYVFSRTVSKHNMSCNEVIDWQDSWKDKPCDSVRQYFIDIEQVTRQRRCSKELNESRFNVEELSERSGRNREDLVTDNLRLVIWVANQYSHFHFDLLDLIQEGNLDLMVASRKYDYERETKYSTYAVHWIRQHIRRYIYRNLNQIRWPDRVIQKVWRGDLDGSGLPRVVFSIEDMPQCLNMSTGCQSDQEQFIITDSVKYALGSLNEKERLVIALRYSIGTDKEMTLQQIGDYLGLTRERVRQIECKAMKKLLHPSRGLCGFSKSKIAIRKEKM